MQLIDDQKMQELFEAFDKAVRWRDLAVYDLNKHGRMYIGLVKTPNEGAGEGFLRNLVARVKEFVSSKKVVDSPENGRAIAIFSDNLEKLRGELESAATALQYLGYRHPDSLAGFPDTPITRTVEAGIDKIVHASQSQSMSEFTIGITPSAWMNEATRALSMAKVMGIPTFYAVNILLSNCERNDKLYKPVLLDLSSSRNIALAFLRTLMQKIPADAPKQHAEVAHSWRYAYDRVQEILQQKEPLTKEEGEELFTACSSISIVADGYQPVGPAAHMAFLVSAYIARFQEILDEYGDYLDKPAWYITRNRQREGREHSLVQSQADKSGEAPKPNSPSPRRRR